MRYQDYVASCSYSSDQVLEEWRWLIGDTVELWFVTKFGDAFLHDPTTQEVQWLNVGFGKVEPVAANQNQFEELSNEPENLDTWFMPEVVDFQKLLGMEPDKNQCQVL
jgi:hypothetical protein